MKTTRMMLSGAFAAALTVTGLTMSLASGPKLDSGVKVGETLSAYHPTHVTGADKQTNTCPVCKYPTNPAVQVWVNDDSAANVAKIATTLEKASQANAGKKFKAFVVFVNADRKPAGVIGKELAAMATKNNLKNVALAYLPGPTDEAVKEYEINTDSAVKNTVFVYKARKVNTKFVNFVADDKGLASLQSAIATVTK